MVTSSRLVSALAVSAALSAGAYAQYIPVDFSAQFNDTRATLINGGGAPFGPQVFTHNTDLVPVNMGGGVDGSGPWSWAAASGLIGPGGVVTLVVPVNISNVQSVFTIINSYWGNANPEGLITVTFNATGGVSQTFTLVGGVDLRDYNQNPSYTNTINNTSTRNVWSNTAGQRLDMQRFDLGPAFAGQTLQNITFNDFGATNFQRMFLTGVTVLVPTPGTLGMLALGGLMVSRRRR
ncbi:MAG: hypothetical protein IBJ18_03640 [Phycisphaerales bacterium]|nr:hypothetical protein [Phycisphaerales bacterium]